jgi:hypothetical protein
MGCSPAHPQAGTATLLGLFLIQDSALKDALPSHSCNSSSLSLCQLQGPLQDSVLKDALPSHSCSNSSLSLCQLQQLSPFSRCPFPPPEKKSSCTFFSVFPSLLSFPSTVFPHEWYMALHQTVVLFPMQIQVVVYSCLQSLSLICLLLLPLSSLFPLALESYRFISFFPTFWNRPTSLFLCFLSSWPLTDSPTNLFAITLHDPFGF